MSEAKDTLLRLIALMRLIPEEPRRIATTTLLEKLKERGFSVTLRSVQRDLARLLGPCSLQCDTDEIPYRWSFMRDCRPEFADMDPPTALALYLSEDHLSGTLPQSVLEQLGPQFRRARNYLDGLGRNGLAHWARRVRSLPNGKALMPAPLASGVWAQVSAALLEGRQLQVEYLSRSKEELKSLCIHPVALVSRHSITYLIGTANRYADLRQFALHRMQSAVVLDAPATEHAEFDLDRYIADGAFSSRQAAHEVELIADVHPQLAWLLNETPLSEQQSLQPLSGSNWLRLRAHVPLDQETLWWIFGLNDQIHVHSPQAWVDEIRLKLESLHRLYSTPHARATPL
ncbi:WYL domain-containing protein [Pseudomonas sp. ZM23]|uniref:WYL domain-containing protein n=1 Tax=Pseudomonas triclosanedens TaxID=2961893 RepID=A0ABY7A6L4_9PSED|nr:WYL domain-containing protein [Pseudomonas triclosanedens]MCP8465074.1 WYL domain-containing protein [Pseudomonas triclosanedens]MCP8470214.1 WYL domain-containing protein [Pseudomonas triclosanedens]MCP8476019.1 WYL domain-containing protein [Pseudomonas triclosanedens]WAI51744.1 WYL domain-containing protein [Pseudomonas triclosanedens]